MLLAHLDSEDNLSTAASQAASQATYESLG